ncbi:hypothetical protein [Clostridium sp. Marseille-Q7071]
MNNFHIKLPACIFMLLDHMSGPVLPNSLFLKIIGRLATTNF